MNYREKLLTYSRYFWDYLKNREFSSIIASYKYLTNKTSHSSDKIIHTSIGTFFCRKNTNDFQFANYYYEWGVKKFFLDHKNEYTVFIDGGACVGEYCILLTQFNIRCIAFEPVPKNFDVLTKNIELNNLKSKVDAFQIGLGDHNYNTKFNYNPVNTGASHIANFADMGDCTANIRTFDSLLPELNISLADNILFKLDVEGMEIEAIRGASNFIRNYPNITFVMEDKHTGEYPIRDTLRKIAPFEFGEVDEFNIFAKKQKT
jgi:FkbM family methyltransferase